MEVLTAEPVYEKQNVIHVNSPSERVKNEINIPMPRVSAGRGYLLVKRAFDILVSLILSVLLSFLEVLIVFQTCPVAAPCKSVLLEELVA